MRPLSRIPFICGNCSRVIRSHPSSSRASQHGSRREFNTASRPFRLAIIGSGPAGFYAASRVMREHNKSIVDMYESLPTPFGLVRYGVAPDHPEVKNCQDRFQEVASLPNFNFIGNIKVGYDIPLAALKPHYDAILFAYGASQDRELNIPGEHLDGVYSARSFVAWYNGLPGSSELAPKINRGKDAVIIGQGNVALDVARILLTDVDELRKTDMPEYALDLLSRNKVRRVRIVGRRGPIQATFTIKEVREITQIRSLMFPEIPRDLFPPDIKTLPRQRKRIAELLIKSGGTITKLSEMQKYCSLEFLLSPCSFQSSKGNPNHLDRVQFKRNRYMTNDNPFEATAMVEELPGGEPVTFDASIAFRSIGYKSEALPGFEDLNVPFDNSRGIIPNSLGRVVVSDPDKPNRISPVPGAYVTGWAKRGPTGVIASTMEDAFSTADSILEDIRSSRSLLSDSSTGLGWDAVKTIAQKSGLRRISWADWRRIDEVEREVGVALGKVREKLPTVSEMLKVLDST